MTMTQERELLDLVQDWHKVKRPLKALGKKELFLYPASNPTEAGEWAFSKEVLARQLAYSDLKKEVAAAEFNLAFCQERKGTTHMAFRATEAKLDAATAKGDSEAQARIALQHREALRAEEVAKVNLERAAERLKAGKEALEKVPSRDDVVSTEEVEDFYRARYLPAWEEIKRMWRDTELMEAQRWGWGSFLLATQKQRGADSRALDHVRKTAMLVGETDGELYKAVQMMHQVRVAPPIPDRQRFVEEGGIKTNLKEEEKKTYWRWWRSYNTATIKNNWADDSGVAYNETMFNPNQKSEQEGGF